MKISKLCFILSVGALLAACSETPRSPEEIVVERAKARWDALIAQDPQTAYQYRTPGYREKTTVMDHAIQYSRRRITWTSAEVLEVECDDQRCTLEISIGYRADGAPGVLSGMAGRRPVEEVWLQIDGEWWYSAGE